MVCLLVDSSMEPLARSKSLSSLSDAVHLTLGSKFAGIPAQGQKRSLHGEDSPPPKRNRRSPVREQPQLGPTRESQATAALSHTSSASKELQLHQPALHFRSISSFPSFSSWSAAKLSVPDHIS